AGLREPLTGAATAGGAGAEFGGRHNGGIRVVIRRKCHCGPWIGREGWRAVRGRHLAVGNIVLGHGNRPPSLIRYRESLEPVDVADLPTAAFLAVLVLVGAGLPACVFAVLS